MYCLCQKLKFVFLFDQTGDELLSDSFPYKEIENGMLWEVEGKVRLFLNNDFFSLKINAG